MDDLVVLGVLAMDAVVSEGVWVLLLLGFRTMHRHDSQLKRWYSSANSCFYAFLGRQIISANGPLSHQEPLGSCGLGLMSLKARNLNSFEMIIRTRRGSVVP